MDKIHLSSIVNPLSFKPASSALHHLSLSLSLSRLSPSLSSTKKINLRSLRSWTDELPYSCCCRARTLNCCAWGRPILLLNHCVYGRLILLLKRYSWGRLILLLNHCVYGRLILLLKRYSWGRLILLLKHCVYGRLILLLKRCAWGRLFLLLNRCFY